MSSTIASFRALMVSRDEDRSGAEPGTETGLIFHSANLLCSTEAVASIWSRKTSWTKPGSTRLSTAAFVTESRTCCSRAGSSTAPPVTYLNAATGSAVSNRCAASSTNFVNGAAPSALATASPVPDIAYSATPAYSTALIDRTVGLDSLVICGGPSFEVTSRSIVALLVQ